MLTTIKILKLWGKVIFLALIIALITRHFLFQSYTITSSSMEKTILKGDRIMVNKFCFGARVPITIFSLPFFNKLYLQAAHLSYYRLPALKSIKRNQILAINQVNQFNKPIDKRSVRVTRCIGLPGDSIQIKNQIIFVNNIRLIDTNTLQYKYRIFLIKNPNNPTKNKLGIIDTILCNSELDAIKQNTDMRFASRLTSAPGAHYQDYFPASQTILWNNDYFGPTIAPYKGMVIKLTNENYDIYKNIICEHEHNTIDIQGHEYYINQKPATTYTFKHDYYFVLNDNRTNANDSRRWGFIPKSHIIGKASFCWFSYDKINKKIRWQNMNKSIN